MVRTILLVLVLCAAVLFVPLWCQLVFFAVALFVTPYRIALLIPAFLADAWYTPTHSVGIASNMMVVGALVAIGLFEVLVRTTRISQYYGLEKK